MSVEKQDPQRLAVLETTGALATLHADRYDASTVTALLDSNSLSDTVGTALDAGFVLLAALAALSTRVLPRWLAASVDVVGERLAASSSIP